MDGISVSDIRGFRGWNQRFGYTCCYALMLHYGTQANVSRETQAYVSRKYVYIEPLLGMFAPLNRCLECSPQEKR